MNEPQTVKVRAVDVKPGRYALWCSIEGGEPFANEICLRRWSEDKSQIIFMLETHNFIFTEPDEEMNLIELPPRDFTRLDEHDRAHMGDLSRFYRTIPSYG